MASAAVTRITREIAQVQKSNDLSIAVACKDEDVRIVRALIVGPPDTPYEFGFFEFHLKFSKSYPNVAPKVNSITTNRGRTRFNPNIYACGKVCLSILGTWTGERGEEWSSAQGLESVLLSIQSLMSASPYENEPGYEETQEGDHKALDYAAKIRHETLRIAVIQHLEDMLGLHAEAQVADPHEPGENISAGAIDPSKLSGSGKSVQRRAEDSSGEYDAEADYNSSEQNIWAPFEDLIKRRFLWYYDVYVRTIEKHSLEQADGTEFEMTEFEGEENGMAGKFAYKSLRARLDGIMSALADELLDWEQLGEEQVTEATQLSSQLSHTFNQLTSKWNHSRRPGARLEISLSKGDNPFIWDLTLFGAPMTNLDGGVFSLKMHIPPNFPDAQPRVVFKTEIFHHCVSSCGLLCYTLDKVDDLGAHLEAIVAAVTDEANAKYDPQAMVNTEAFELFWGGAESRKVYNRKLRRSAQNSSDLL